MTASSDPKLRSAAALWGRFIPREELGGFTAWRPGSFSGEAPAAPAAAPAEPPPPPPEPGITPEELEAQVQAARQSGYQDGWRAGLAALEDFKQGHASQLSAQVGAVAAAFQARLAGVEQQLAAELAGVALEVARQVVRSELDTRPERVEAVVREALAALVASARQVRVRVHPEDHRLLAEQAGLDLEAHHARLAADPSVSRGGCLVDCDVGRVDATIETRWRRASAALGAPGEWSAGEAGEPAR